MIGPLADRLSVCVSFDVHVVHGRLVYEMAADLLVKSKDKRFCLTNIAQFSDQCMSLIYAYFGALGGEKCVWDIVLSTVTDCNAPL